MSCQIASKNLLGMVKGWRGERRVLRNLRLTIYVAEKLFDEKCGGKRIKTSEKWNDFELFLLKFPFFFSSSSSSLSLSPFPNFSFILNSSIFLLLSSSVLCVFVGCRSLLPSLSEKVFLLLFFCRCFRSSFFPSLFSPKHSQRRYNAFI